MAMASPAVAGATEPTVPSAAVITPADGYSSIDSCTLSFSPSTFSASDSVIVTTTFGSTPGSYRIGADGLGSNWASVLVGATTPLSTANIVTPIPVTTLRASWGLAPGTHSMDFYAVDGTGAAIGSPLCSATYTFTGEPEPIVFKDDGFADVPFRVGEPVSADGAFTYTPTSSARLTRCDLIGATYPLESVSLGDGRSKTIMLGTGLEFIPATADELESSLPCGRLSGTPTLPGTYTMTSMHSYVCPSTTAPGFISAAVSAGVDEQTYAGTRTFTIVVEATPVFTG